MAIDVIHVIRQFIKLGALNLVGHTHMRSKVLAFHRFVLEIHYSPYSIPIEYKQPTFTHECEIYSKRNSSGIKI